MKPLTFNQPKPLLIKRFLQLGEQRIRILPVSVDHVSPKVVETVYAKADVTPREGKKRSVLSKQGKAILALFESKPDEMIPAVELHRVASGKEHGFAASLSRRISDLRDLGYNIVKTLDERVEGQRRTGYSLIKNHDLYNT
jgi:hypothetical protein